MQMTPIKTITSWACILVAAFATWAGALEISQLHLPMNRAEADKELSKDYSYEVLQDGSIRRTWKLDGKTVMIDFNSVDGSAIMISISYHPAISAGKANADANALAQGKRKENDRWLKTNKEATEPVGLSNAVMRKLTDDTYQFRESNEKKKITRITHFARLPHTNRWELQPASTNTRTAMGNRSGADNVKALLADEERRKNSGARPGSLAANTTSQTKASPLGPPEQGTPVSPLQPARQDASLGAAGTASPEAAQPQEGGKKQAGNIIELLGLDHPNPLHYCVGGILLLILLFIIGGRLSAAKRKAKARANFNEVLKAKPMNKTTVRKK